MPHDAQRRHNGPYRPAIGCIIHPLHQTIRLQPIGKLRDVGSNTVEAPRQLAECERLSGTDERVQRLIFRRGQSDGVKGRLELLLNAPGGMQ